MSTVTVNAFDLNTWYYESHNSIFVKCVPHGMTSVNIAENLKFIGEIDRVDIVNSPKGHQMAFVHFNFWYDNPNSHRIRKNIIESYPQSSAAYFTNPDHVLHLTVNIKPIPKLAYNNYQLSDMYERLRETVAAKDAEIASMRKELDEYKSVMGSAANFRAELDFIKRTLLETMPASEINAKFQEIQSGDEGSRIVHLQKQDDCSSKDNGDQGYSSESDDGLQKRKRRRIIINNHFPFYN